MHLQRESSISDGVCCLVTGENIQEKAGWSNDKVDQEFQGCFVSPSFFSDQHVYCLPHCLGVYVAHCNKGWSVVKVTPKDIFTDKLFYIQHWSLSCCWAVVLRAQCGVALHQLMNNWCFNMLFWHLEVMTLLHTHIHTRLCSPSTIQVSNTPSALFRRLFMGLVASNTDSMRIRFEILISDIK